MKRCDRCIGRRLVGAQGPEIQREHAGVYRAAHDLDEVEEADCEVCEGCFADADHWLAAALAAAGSYAAGEFQVGTVFPKACEEREKAWKPMDDIGDTIRTEANRLLGPKIADATDMTWATDGRPELVITVDTRFWHAEARANSIFVAGRYTKHRRDLPQTHWPCKRCSGLGCWDCDDAGVLYESSVEDVIAEAAEPLFGADGSSFHGAGREDIDALMLGTGRPFVIELHDPHDRAANLDVMAAQINAATEESGVGVRDLRMTEKEEVARIKAGEYQKEYLAHCLAEESVRARDVQAAADRMEGVVLQQRTPERVSHRRADLVRERTVQHIEVERPPGADGKRFSLRVLAESGTYIKEMVSGDGGRTTPSFADEVGVPTTVEYLDVVAILDAPAVAPGQAHP